MLEARLHPRIVRSQVTSPSFAAKRPAACADCPHVADELGEIVREGRGFAWIVVGGHDTGQPCLHGPRKRIASSGFTKRDRLWRAKPGTT